MDMELLFCLAKIMATFLLLRFIAVLKSLLDAVILKPRRLRSKLQNQGIRGPPPSFLLGNLWDMTKTRLKRFKNSKLPQQAEQVITHNCSSIVLPYLNQWRNQYGPTFLFSLGNLQILHTNHPNMVKEITTCTSFDLGRSSYQTNWVYPLLGRGVGASNGEQWAHQRKIIAPEFFMDKVKGMTKLMAESAVMIVESWHSKIDCEGGVADIKIDEYMRNFAADVIAKACFGSNYAEGEEIFSKLRALQEIVAEKMLIQGIPGMRYLPTKSMRDMWGLQKEIHGLILEVVKGREEATSNNENHDLLQVLLESAKKSKLGQEARESFIVDNCKTIYFGGHESSALSVTWTLMLLALNPEWQDKVRAEVLEVSRGELLDFEMLRKMKTLTMVINESLRLYPPVSMMIREALKDLHLGGICVPKGVTIWVPIMTLHEDPNIWGPDADKFNPERFVNGLSGACQLPCAYMPFGTGPHTCLGQYFAMTELKILLSLLLSNFKFSLSPKYRHSPVLNLVIEPEHGVDLLVRKL